MNKPTIELKNIKHFEPLSHETHCFSATLYVDGKKFATVENDGQGGADAVHPVDGNYKTVQDLEARIKATYPRIEDKYFPDGLEPCLEIICADLVTEFLVKKDLQKILRRVSYVKQGQKGVYQLPAKYKPTTETIARIKATAPWAKDVTFFAGLSPDEALKLFKDNA